MEEPNGGFYWLPLNVSGLSHLPVLPAGAVIAGYEHGRPTYVARVRWGDQWELGKLNAWAKFGYGYYGKEIEEDEGEVLVARDDVAPAWINGAFGEHVPSVMMSRGPEGYQSVGRGWYQGRWVPGKVVHSCRMLFFPFGGKEMAVRKYQLLSTGFAWKSTTDETPPDGAVCPDEAQPWVGSSSNLIRYSPGDHTAPADPILIKTTETRECKWEVSGDGEYVKHAIAGLDGRSVARVWVEKDGVAGWAAATVTALWHNGRAGGVHYLGRLYRDYQVLTAGAPETGPNILSLHLQLDAAGHLVNSTNPPSKDVLLAKSLGKGENPWVAVLQMVNLAEEKLREKAEQPLPETQEQPPAVDQGMVSLMDQMPTAQLPATAAAYPVIQPPVQQETQEQERQLQPEVQAPAGSGSIIRDSVAALKKWEEARGLEAAGGSGSSSQHSVAALNDWEGVKERDAATQTDEESMEVIQSAADQEPPKAVGSEDISHVDLSVADAPREGWAWAAPEAAREEGEAAKIEVEEDQKSDSFRHAASGAPSTTAAQHEYGYTSDEYDFVDDVSFIP